MQSAVHRPAPTVVLIAPLAPDRAIESLGATAKLEMVIRMLRNLGFAVHLVDSSHPRLPPGRLWAAAIHGRPGRIEGEVVIWSRPFCIASRRLGKLLNIFLAGFFVARLAALRPVFIWIYNAYAFEGRLALKLTSRCRAPIVLELEDLPLARNRRLNPKPYLDEWYFRRLLRRVSLITFVNHVLMQRYDQARFRKLLLPSVLRGEFLPVDGIRKFAGATYTLGYFGGLEVDKGADVLLEALPRLPPGWRLVVTGRGELHERFAAAAARHPGRMAFLGVVDRARLTEAMRGCDAIVNPHKPIAAMGEGVFPFKVCESIAVGALLISTPLPAIEIDLSRGIRFFSGSSDALVDAVAGAPGFYAAHHADIAELRAAVCDRFSRATIEGQLSEQISHLVGVVTPAAASLTDAEATL
jgi:glycosyltransferase involved in cell wall biosynthesis